MLAAKKLARQHGVSIVNVASSGEIIFSTLSGLSVRTSANRKDAPRKLVTLLRRVIPPIKEGGNP